MRTKKAQIKMTETFAILFIFFILLVLVVSFFAKFQKVGFDRAKAEKTDLRSIETVQKVASLPELQCSTKDIVTEACYDLLKLEYFDDLVDSGNPADNQKLIEQYHDLFGYSNISVRRIFPIINNPTQAANPAGFEENNVKMLYSNPGNGTTLTSVIPILLTDVTTNQNIFSLLKVTFYSQSK